MGELCDTTLIKYMESLFSRPRAHEVLYPTRPVWKIVDRSSVCTWGAPYGPQSGGRNLPYVPGELRMDPKTEVCLYPCGGAACAPMALVGIPPESQFSWHFGRYLIMPI
jgi:hypothetical protein